MQRAQVAGGFGIEGGDGDDGAGIGAGAVVEWIVVDANDDVVAVERARLKGSMKEIVRVSAGCASVGFVREREGGWMGERGFREGRGGGVCFGVVGVVEARLVMRRGRGTRLRSGGVVEVLVGGWREGAERLWEMEDRRAIG